MNYMINMKNKEELINKLNMSPNDLNAFNHYVKYRGLDDHIKAYEYLVSLNNNVNYSMIASVLRYDKRIKRILFKYISFIEEYVKASICNYYTIDTYPIKNIKGDNIFEHYQDKQYSYLINDFIRLDDSFILSVFDNYKKNNLLATIKVRNVVSHSYFLLGYLNYNKCVNEKIKSSSYRSNIINIKNLLPEFMRKSFTNEINNAYKAKKNKYEFQVSFNLPKCVIIKI